MRGDGYGFVVTENGIADSQDLLRPAYLLEHLLALRAAQRRGIRVRGYTFWTASDNWVRARAAPHITSFPSMSRPCPCALVCHIAQQDATARNVVRRRPRRSGRSSTVQRPLPFPICLVPRRSGLTAPAHGHPNLPISPHISPYLAGVG